MERHTEAVIGVGLAFEKSRFSDNKADPDPD
jgi:hypothetical protein